MNDDIEAAIALKQRFPNQIFLIRYEDMALNPVYETGKILDFLDLEFTKSIREFLDSHTKGSRRDVFKKHSNFGVFTRATTITTTNCEHSPLSNVSSTINIASSVNTSFPTTTTMTNCEHGTLSNVSTSTAATINIESSVNTSVPTTTTTTTSTTTTRNFFELHRFHAHHLPRGGVQFDTFRNSRKNAFAWTTQLNISTVKTIQEVCSVPMARLGFNLMTDESQLKDQNFQILKVTEDLKFLQNLTIDNDSAK